jgi:hypothetical protein
MPFGHRRNLSVHFFPITNDNIQATIANIPLKAIASQYSASLRKLIFDLLEWQAWPPSMS